MEVINGNSDEKVWAMFCHLSAFLGFIFPFGGVIGPLIIWSVKKEEYPMVDRHGKQSLNFQISILIYAICSVVLVFLFIGIGLLVLLGILNLILVIIAAVKANNGEDFEYPLSIRFIQ